MIVLAIIGLIASLSFPVVFSARETARTFACASNVRQLGQAFMQFEAINRQYPSNGWGYAWVGDSSINNTKDQPGSWLFSVLPYIDQQPLWQKFDGRANPPFNALVPNFYCPGRRQVKVYSYGLQRIPLRNATLPSMSLKSDYAVCQGDELVPGGPGPTANSPQAIAGYKWTSLQKIHGVSGPRTAFRSSDVKDGLSNTIMIGEKALYISDYYSGQSKGDDQSPFIGDDVDNHRITAFTPTSDFYHNDVETFGSAHRSGVNFVTCDGSTQFISFSIDAATFKVMGSRSDQATGLHR